jgi:hypothetical protein
MLFFTTIIGLVYTVALGEKFISRHSNIEAFPGFHQSRLALIGIRHAGYLTYKAIPDPKIKPTPRATIPACF